MKLELLDSEVKYKLVCKKTGREFFDVSNSSGSITTHLLEFYPEVEQPSAYIKRQYKIKNNKYWHEQFFDSIEYVEKEFKTCKYCDWKTVDVDNKSGQYTLHLSKNHGKSIDDYLIEFPDESTLFKTYVSNKERFELINSDDSQRVTCLVCGKIFKKISNTHLMTHGLSETQYKIKYGGVILSENLIDRQREIYQDTLRDYESNFVSRGQQEVFEFLESIGVDAKMGDKKTLHGVELDILCQENNVAIEFNGNYYHSEISGKKDRNFHLNKTKLCEQNNIRLIHIFEDEWHQKKDIVKSMLKNIFKKSSIKIHARKCIIKEIDSIVKNDFLNRNHIFGEDRSKIKIGAYYNEQLIAVMTFDNSRGMSLRNNDLKIYELKRFAVKQDVSSSGLSSKMLKFFINNYSPNKIVSFADIRFVDMKNNLYIKLNFKEEDVLSPDYSYYNSKMDKYKRLHKFNFGKKFIKKKFPNIYSSDLSEWEMMRLVGYDRIWDCGKIRYVLNCTKK